MLVTPADHRSERGTLDWVPSSFAQDVLQVEAVKFFAAVILLLSFSLDMQQTTLRVLADEFHRLLDSICEDTAVHNVTD